MKTTKILTLEYQMEAEDNREKSFVEAGQELSPTVLDWKLGAWK